MATSLLNKNSIPSHRKEEIHNYIDNVCNNESTKTYKPPLPEHWSEQDKKYALDIMNSLYANFVGKLPENNPSSNINSNLLQAVGEKGSTMFEIYYNNDYFSNGSSVLDGEEMTQENLQNIADELATIMDSVKPEDLIVMDSLDESEKRIHNDG